MGSSFTVDEGAVDAESKVFLDDPTLPGFLVVPKHATSTSTDSHCILVPFLCKRTAQDCMRYLKRSAPAVLEATYQMVSIEF